MAALAYSKITFCREKKQQLFTLLFEKNPIDETCDQRVVVDSQPLKIVYDAVS